MGETPAGVSGIIGRLELNGLSEVLDSAIEGVCLKMRRPSGQITREIIGIDLNCLGVNRDWIVNLLIRVCRPLALNNPGEVGCVTLNISDLFTGTSPSRRNA